VRPGPQVSVTIARFSNQENPMDKLDAVELTFDPKERGESIICHYASGRTITHPYRDHTSTRYCLAARRCDSPTWVLRARDCLDRGFAMIMIRP
jgi:hypothetical protein